MKKIDEKLAKKLQNLNKLDLWIMILWIISIPLFIIGYVMFFVSIAINDPNLADDGTTISWQSLSILLIGILIAFVYGIALLVLQIIAAVRHNSKEIKDVYEVSGVGNTPGILAIIGIFFAQFIFSVIIYAMTNRVLKHPEEAIERHKKLIS